MCGGDILKTSSKSFARLDFTQVLVGLAGILYLLTGLALLVAPAWFFATIGPYPPFNRHYMGDLGAFLLPLGAGLLLAARDPSKHKLLVRIAVAGSGLHALNHTYDAVFDRAPLGHWLVDTLPLLIFGVLLLLAERRATARTADSGIWGS